MTQRRHVKIDCHMQLSGRHYYIFTKLNHHLHQEFIIMNSYLAISFSYMSGFIKTDHKILYSNIHIAMYDPEKVKYN